MCKKIKEKDCKENDLFEKNVVDIDKLCNCMSHSSKVIKDGIGELKEVISNFCSCINDNLENSDGKLKIIDEHIKKSLCEKSNEIENKCQESINKELKEIEQRIQNFESRINNETERMKHECEAEKTREIERVKHECETEKTREIERLKREYEIEKAKTMSQLNEITQEKEKVAGVVGKFEEINSSYKSLLEKVIKCESMKDFSISKRLDEIYNSDSPEKILEFRSIVGNEYSFAIDVCNALKNFKKKSDNPQPVTQDEIELIDEVNEFYKKREKRTDESDKLLYLPKGFNADNVSGARVPFLSSEMMDISNPLENQFEYISDVYTPCFKKYDSISPLVKALVKGRIKR